MNKNTAKTESSFSEPVAQGSVPMDSIFERHSNAKRDALIPILQEIQEAEGFLSRKSIVAVGRHLGLPTSKIYGVATFYNGFRFEKKGRYHIQICRGTACHVKGSLAVLKAFQQALKIQAGRTTRDGMFSLEVVACIGACGLAPVISVNGEFHAAVTPDKVRKIIKTYRKKAVEKSTEKAVEKSTEKAENKDKDNDSSQEK